MKILAMSDIHGQFHKFDIDKMPDANEVDMVIIAGDLTNVGVNYPVELNQHSDLSLFDFENAKVFIEQFENKYGLLSVFWIPGNHDWGLLERHWELGATLISFDSAGEWSGCGKKTTIIGESLSTALDMPHLAKIWAHTTADPQVDLDAWRNKPYADIVVSHSPPFGILDMSPGNRRIGSRGLTKYIEWYRPKLVICGHVHECKNGYMNYKGTQIYNVATTWRVIELE